MCTYTHILHIYIYTHMFYMYTGALRYELPEIPKVFQDLIGASLCVYVQLCIMYSLVSMQRVVTTNFGLTHFCF